ncbi:MAG: hypothetical protein SPJ65_05850 [Roseburia sp.]|nr:hypothetical protein [Roseburia sp.]
MKLTLGVFEDFPEFSLHWCSSIRCFLAIFEKSTPIIFMNGVENEENPRKRLMLSSQWSRKSTKSRKTPKAIEPME